MGSVYSFVTMKLFVILALVVTLVVCEKAKEDEPNSGKEYIMDIPKGMEFIEEEFIEPIAEADVNGENLGDFEEPVELLSKREMEDLEKDLSDIETLVGPDADL